MQLKLNVTTPSKWICPSVVNLPVTQFALDCIMVTYKTTIYYSR